MSRKEGKEKAQSREVESEGSLMGQDKGPH